MGLKQAADLRAGGPGGTADPYARVSLSTGAGHTHETRVHRGTLCPTFHETCCFHVRLGWGRGGAGGRGRGEGARSHALLQVPQRELARTALRVQVLSFRRFSAHEPLAELSLPLGTVDPQHVLEQWYQLGPPGTTEVSPGTAGLRPGPARGAPGVGGRWRPRPPISLPAARALG